VTLYEATAHLLAKEGAVVGVHFARAADAAAGVVEQGRHAAGHGDRLAEDVRALVAADHRAHVGAAVEVDLHLLDHR
jgi:hypothetical protein